MPSPPRSASVQEPSGCIERDAQHEGHDQHGRDRNVNARVLALDSNIARKTAEPRQSSESGEQADKDGDPSHGDEDQAQRSRTYPCRVLGIDRATSSVRLEASHAGTLDDHVAVLQALGAARCLVRRFGATAEFDGQRMGTGRRPIEDLRRTRLARGVVLFQLPEDVVTLAGTTA
jgi:hypothetical protein